MLKVKRAVSLPVEMALLGLLGAVGALGCGGDDGGETSDVAGLQAGSPNSNNSSNSNSGTASGAFGDSGARDVCSDSTLLDRAPPLPEPKGKAHFTPIPVTEDEAEVDLVEITCEVSRNQAGEVVGFYASFFTRFQESFLGDFASVSWSGKFAGAGQYDNAKLTYAYRYDVSDSSATGPLVIDADGLTGHFTAAKAELNFQCGDASKLSPQTVPWPPQPERTVRTVSNDGTVHEYPGLECGTNDGEFELDILGEPYIYRVQTDGTGTGSHRVTSTDTDYAGGASKISLSGGGTLTLDCGTSPVSGMINDRTTFVCGK